MLYNNTHGPESKMGAFVLRRNFVLFLCVFGIAAFGAGCADSNPAGGDIESQRYISEPEPEASSEAPKLTVNPLTGEENLAPGLESKRPVAIMINNIKAAWDAQTGVGAADIVYETLVEGGITRLMAVYQNIGAAPTIGTVRSARYSYAELALSLDAIYISMGADKKYYEPYQKQLGIQWYNLMSHEAASFRVKNGKAYEHTLYTSGERLSKNLAKANIRMNVRDSRKKTIFDFAPPAESRTLSGGTCNTLKVNFSDTYGSSYKYDPAAKTYLKLQGGSPHKDYKTGAQLKVRNVFVLFTKVTEFSDGYHVKSDLSSGSGYYATEGTYQEISWSKGAAANLFTFTNKDGTPLVVNAGKSWVSIADQAHRPDFAIG